MEMIRTVAAGPTGVVLIPGDCTAWQTVMRFIRYLVPVSVMHSRMSAARAVRPDAAAANGESWMMIGPRSALFTPFPNLGLIVIDENMRTVIRVNRCRDIMPERRRSRGGDGTCKCSAGFGHTVYGKLLPVPDVREYHV